MIVSDIINNSMNKLNDKSFAWACIVFIAAVSALFTCSILSSTWAANKTLGDTKVFKIISTCVSHSQEFLQKPRHH
jgi:hypothetical protein